MEDLSLINVANHTDLSFFFFAYPMFEHFFWWDSAAASTTVPSGEPGLVHHEAGNGAEKTGGRVTGERWSTEDAQ